MLKTLLVYHSAARASAQRVFDALSSYDDIELRVLAPKKGRSRLNGDVRILPRQHSGQYRLVSGRVWRAMDNICGPYLTGMLREFLFFRPDIVHVFYEAYSGAYSQALLCKKLFLPKARCLGLAFENLPARTPRSAREKLKQRFVNAESDGVTCCSTGAKSALIASGFPEGKLHVAYWGISLDDFQPMRDQVLRSELGWSDDFIVGYVGRMEREKGIWSLLLALATLPSSVKCLCLGEGAWKELWLMKIKAYGLDGRVICKGSIPHRDMPRYINALDALVLPSETSPTWMEQFGRVLPEAMACGVPVIGSNSGAIPEIVGDAGVIFPERDHVKLADAIGDLMSDNRKRRELGQNGIRRASEIFSCTAFAARLRNLYHG